MSQSPPSSRSDRFPSQIKYIVGNEACERFSFYGMIGILQVYVSKELGAGDDHATEISHLFKSANYFLPLLGAWLADRFLGRYRSILFLSLFYCLGHLMMALGEKTYWGLYTGLGLIALGSGGIKPSVSAFVGDQFGSGQGHLLRKAYGWFYWSINFGSFFSFLVIPEIRDRWGYGWAFGIPGIFMGIATLVFWLGTRHYKMVPSAGDPPALFWSSAIRVLAALGGGISILVLAPRLGLHPAFRPVAFLVYAAVLIVWSTRALQRTVESRRNQPSGAFTVIWYLWTKQLGRPRGQGFYDVARQWFTAESIEGAQAVLRVLKVLALIPFFWALYDQTNSTWVTQGTQMASYNLLGLKIDGEKMQSMNALLVMILVPVFTLWTYPSFDRTRFKASPVNRMLVGLGVTAFSYVVVALLQQRIDAAAQVGQKISVMWQTVPYIILTAGEVLVSATGNEFAFTHAPKTMKSTMTSIWLLTISVGNLLVAFFTMITAKLSGAAGGASSHAASPAQFFRYAALTAVVTVVFWFVASRFKGRNYIENPSA